MALDRLSIERKDFPIGRRGYEPAVVDEHLQQIADEIEDIELSDPHPAGSLADAASEQVRLIVEAAEKTASDVRRQAEQEARRTREQAAADAQNARAQAAEQAAGHVARASDAVAQMLGRIESMEKEFSSLTDHLRAGAQVVLADLNVLQVAVSDAREVSGAARESVEDKAPSVPAPVAAEDLAYDEPDDLAYEPAAVPTAAAPAASGPEDVEGARLIALNMALNGAPREETAAYLAENFGLTDPDALLNEVYARVGG